MGRFVQIDVARAVGERAAGVVRSCPVDIFATDSEDVLTTIPAREDECLLCGQCIAASAGGVRVTRTYGSRATVEAAHA